MSKKRLHTISTILLTMEDTRTSVNTAWAARLSARGLSGPEEKLFEIGNQLNDKLADCVVAFSARRDRAADDRNFRRCAENLWPILDGLPSLGDDSASPLLALKEYVRTLCHEIVSAENTAERALDAILDLRWITDAVEEVLYGQTDADSDETFLEQPELLANAPDSLNDPSLEDGEKLFLSLFQTSLMSIFIINDKLRIIAANNSALELWGTSLDDITEHPVPDLVSGADRGVLVSRLDNLEDGDIGEISATGRHLDGRTFPAHLILSRIDLGDGSYFQITAQNMIEHQELERQLNEEKAQVKEMAVTLRHVIRATADEKKKLKQRLAEEVEARVLPALGHIADEDSQVVRNGYRSVIENRLEGLTQGASSGIAGKLLRLTPTELEVCRLIRAGQTTKEIAEMLHSAHDTIQTHRKNIRRKLDLRGQKIALHTFLNSKEVSL